MQTHYSAAVIFSLLLTTMMCTGSRVLITLCHIVLIALCRVRYTNADNIKYVDISELSSENAGAENPVPIVGILSQEEYEEVAQKYPNRNITSYIAACYVKFVEGGGGRVIPIWIGKDRAYYEDIMSKINGILLPGGITNVYDTNGYGDAFRHIYKIAMEKNDRGVRFPIWGTCLGFQYFLYISANETDIFSYCESWGQALPLEFKDDFQQSRIFKNADADVINILSKYPVTTNFHHICVTEEALSNLNLNESWRVISVNQDFNGLQFVSTIEHRRYPFYGIQYHPEKSLYEFKLRNITHSSRATRAAQYLANFFISETRQNLQHFSNETEEEAALIYNYAPTYTALQNVPLVQEYFFEGEGQQPASNDAGGGRHYGEWNAFSFLMSYIITHYAH